jgi:SOS-response transcriptional repressor LexA
MIVSTPERIAVSWLKYVNGWLCELGEKSALSEPAQLLLDKLKHARDKNESKLAWDIINDLRRLSDKSEDRESAEIRLKCGLVAAEMDNFRDALRLLLEASSKYANYQHQRAVAFWMIGCTQWLLPDKEVDAINSWRNAVKVFEALKDHNKAKQQNNNWYDEKCKEMRMALNIATEQYRIPPLPDGLRDQQYSNEANPISGSRFNNISNSVLKSFPVIGVIPAGTPIGMLPEEDDEIGIDVVEIEDGKYYKMLSMRKEGVIRWQSRKEYFVLRVHGDSMNRAVPIPIYQDDYVLMVVQDAVNGDVVAAEIVGIDRRATLKRYGIQNGHPVLSPESNNPDFQTSLPDEKFLIRGVALAVLKYDEKYSSER